MSDAKTDAIRLFSDTFRHLPEILVRAPGRINLIGEHIDYLDGQVLPAAIDRHVYGVGRRIEEPVLRITTTMLPSEKGPIEVSVDRITRFEKADDAWLNYIAGVVAVYRRSGSPAPGMELAFSSNLPTGAGLSSSAALETATALMIESASGVSQDPVDRALLCQAAEHEFAGVPCGAMDQLSVGLGRAGAATLIDCRDFDFRSVPIPEEISIVVTDSGVKHALADGEYRKRRNETEVALEKLGAKSWRQVGLDEISDLPDPLHRRARHVVTEMKRVGDFADAMDKGQLERIAPIMRAGHDSLKDDFEVSCAELDFLVDAAYEFDSIVGSRMTGGGFGGSTVSLVPHDQAENLVLHLQRRFESEFQRSVHPFATIASEGAQILS